MPRDARTDRRLRVKKETLRKLDGLSDAELAGVAGGSGIFFSAVCTTTHTTSGASVGGTARCP